MNILLINKYFFLKGGSERQVFDLIAVLEKNKHRVIPFAMEDERNEKTPFQKYFFRKVDLHRFSVFSIIKYFHNYDAVRRLEKLLDDEKVDIAHLHNIVGQVSPAIIKSLKERGIPVVQTLHDYRLFCPNGQLFAGGKVCYSCVGKSYYHCFFKKCVHNAYGKSLIGSLEAYLNTRFLDLYSQVDCFIAPSHFMR